MPPFRGEARRMGGAKAIPIMFRPSGDGFREKLKFGKDPHNQHFAREIINSPTREISEMREWLKQK